MFSAFLGETTREDFIPYTADFLLQVEDVKWTIVSGIVGGQLIVSVRNLGYSRNAGEFVKANFGDIGSAGGHRAMAKAVVPVERFRGKFGDLSGVGIAARIGELAEQFLRTDARRKHELSTVRGPRLASPGRVVDGSTRLGPRQRSSSELQPASTPDELSTPAPDPDPRSGRRRARARPRAGSCRASRRRPQLLVGEAVLRRQHRQAAEALDAAEARRALNDLQAIEDAAGGLVAAADSKQTMPPKPVICAAAIAWSGCDGRPG